jgi:hypothetical protein
VTDANLPSLFPLFTPCFSPLIQFLTGFEVHALSKLNHESRQLFASPLHASDAIWETILNRDYPLKTPLPAGTGYRRQVLAFEWGKQCAECSCNRQSIVEHRCIDLLTDVKTCTKSTLLSTYKLKKDQFDHLSYVSVRNPHYKTAAPMSLYTERKVLNLVVNLHFGWVNFEASIAKKERLRNRRRAIKNAREAAKQALFIQWYFISQKLAICLSVKI